MLVIVVIVVIVVIGQARAQSLQSRLPVLS
jgi:hypothetical protein